MSKNNASHWFQKWYVWATFALLLFIVLLPTLLSTGPGTKMLLGFVHSSTGKEIQVESLSLSWFGPQKANGVSLKDEERHLTFTCKEAETETPLWKVSNLDASIKVHEGKLEIEAPDLPSIAFYDIEILLNMPKPGLPLIFTMTGKTEQQGQVGAFDVKAEISGLDTNQPQGNLKANVSQLPVEGIDQILELNGTLVAAIGKSIDLTIDASTVKNAISMNAKAISPLFNADVQTVSEDHLLTLKTPAHITLSITPALASRLTNLTLTAPAQLTVMIDKLSCPYNDDGLDYQNLAFNSTLDLTPAVFKELTLSSLKARVSSLKLSDQTDVVLDVTSPQFTLARTSFAISDTLRLTAPTSLSYTMSDGDKLLLSLQAFSVPMSPAIELMKMEGDLQVPAWNIASHIKANTWDSILVSATGRNFQTAFEAKIQDKALIVKNPFTITTSVTSAQLEDVFPDAALAQPATVKIDMQPLSLPIMDFDVKKLQCQGKAYTDQLLLTSKGGARQFTLKNPSVQFSVDGKAERANMTVALALADGSFKADFALSQISLEDTTRAILTVNGNIQSLRTSFIDTLLGKDYALNSLLGNAFDLNFTLSSTSEKQTLALKAKSPNMYISGGFSLSGNMIELQSPGLECNFTVSKEAYPLIDEGPFQLQKPAVCSLKIQEMQWPVVASPNSQALLNRMPTIAFDWNQIRLKGEAYLKELDYDKFALSNTELRFQKTDLINFSLASALSPQGQINIVGEMPSNSTSQIKMHALIKDFPTIILDLFARLAGQKDLSFLPVFGKTLNVNAKVDLNNFNGPVALSLTSENTRASFAGEVQDGFLTLNESLHAQVLMTPELSAVLLKQVNPLSIKEITSKSPITLEISSSGFLLPIHPYDPTKLFIGKGRLELGKIACHNEGNINTTLGLLKWGKVGKGDILKLWFAPLDFSIKQGVVAIERTEVLVADSFEIALWGNLDLPKEYVDMILGLTPSALRAAFGIKDLPKNYVLQIPMRGPMNDVSIDTGSATTKIALLLAWQQKALGNLGGSTGSFLGGLINKAVPLPDLQAKAPPAKRPFPWEQAEKQKTGGKPIRKGDKPLKQLLKVLN